MTSARPAGWLSKRYPMTRLPPSAGWNPSALPARRLHHPGSASMTKPPEPTLELRSFTAQLPFTLDEFQLQACRALEQGHGVLVCAPTGAGKTVVDRKSTRL